MTIWDPRAVFSPNPEPEQMMLQFARWVATLFRCRIAIVVTRPNGDNESMTVDRLPGKPATEP